jgi:hypothetical protein
VNKTTVIKIEKIKWNFNPDDKKKKIKYKNDEEIIK